MENGLNNSRKRIEELELLIKTNDKMLDELLEDRSVKQFIAISEQNKKLIGELKSLTVSVMQNCAHIFVKTNEVVDTSDSHRSCKDEVFYCIKCGLTNYYSVLDLPLDEEKRLMSYIFVETSHFGTLISEDICSLESAKTVYEILITTFPRITIKELKEKFALLYPLFEDLRNVDEIKLSDVLNKLLNNGNVKVKN